MTVQFGGLLALALAAFAAPLAARAIPRHLVPPVVLEVLVGIVIGPQALDLVDATGGVYTLYLLGFWFLLFLAGQEVEVERFRGPTFRLTAASFVVSLNLLNSATAAALVGAALLSVLIFPAVALALRPWSPARTAPAPATPATPA